MKSIVITVLLALVLPFGSKTKAEEKVRPAISRSEKPCVADWIANQFHPHSTEPTVGAADLSSIPAGGNLDVPSEVTASSEVSMDKGGSGETIQTGQNFSAQAFTTKMTLSPESYEPRWRRPDLWLAPIKKTEEAVIYKHVEFSGVFAHLSDLFVEPQKFLQLFNPFAPPGYGVATTTRSGLVLWSFGF